jgi:hypothetical protein
MISPYRYLHSIGPFPYCSIPMALFLQGYWPRDSVYVFFYILYCYHILLKSPIHLEIFLGFSKVFRY